MYRSTYASPARRWKWFASSNFCVIFSWGKSTCYPLNRWLRTNEFPSYSYSLWYTDPNVCAISTVQFLLLSVKVCYSRLRISGSTPPFQNFLSKYRLPPYHVGTFDSELMFYHAFRPLFRIFTTYTPSYCSIRLLISSARVSWSGLSSCIPAVAIWHLQGALHRPPLIYALEFGDVGWKKHFPSVAATWLYKVLSRFRTGTKITLFLNFSLKFINSVFPHFLLMKLFFEFRWHDQ